MSHPHVPTEDFTRGMRHLAAAVNVICATGADGTRVGFTATAACSLAAEPPTLLVCSNKSVSALPTILSAGHFSVNVLANAHEPIARAFASKDREMRFREGNWNTLLSGAPVLEGCLANFDCEVIKTMDWETHTILLGKVIGVTVNPEAIPLIYVNGSFTTSALHLAS